MAAAQLHVPPSVHYEYHGTRSPAVCKSPGADSTHHVLGLGPRYPPWTLHSLSHTKIKSKRRRRLLQLVRLVSPSLHVGPAPFARGSRHVRPGKGQSASCRRRSIAASASPPLPSHSVATRHLAVVAQASPPLQPHAVAARHRAVAASASPPCPPRAVSASPQLRLLLLSSTTRAQT